MKALLLIAHGSRREASNQEVRDLAARMNNQANDFDRVSCAFLELAEPLIPDGIREAVKHGANDIVVLPYFLSAGRHVVTDVPEEVNSVLDEFPHVKISMAPYLGIADKIPDLLFEQAAQTV